MRVGGIFQPQVAAMSEARAQARQPLDHPCPLVDRAHRDTERLIRVAIKHIRHTDAAAACGVNEPRTRPAAGPGKGVFRFNKAVQRSAYFFPLAALLFLGFLTFLR